LLIVVDDENFGGGIRTVGHGKCGQTLARMTPQGERVGTGRSSGCKFFAGTRSLRR
jgi:hypothetical protein